MGLLDDAIREHLDLKRRRGADPSEIAKEEADALGPVRRTTDGDEPVAADDVVPADEPAALDEPAAAYDDEPEPPRPEPSFYDDRPVPAEEPRTHEHAYAEPEQESASPPHGDPLAHQQTREFSATELDDALRHHDDEPPAREPEPATPPALAPAADLVPAADEDAEDEDVLEETPDFLQETPEHDRLWFEQKPPKDFDF
jgi:hypothetical protein